MSVTGRLQRRYKTTRFSARLAEAVEQSTRRLATDIAADVTYQRDVLGRSVSDDRCTLDYWLDFPRHALEARWAEIPERRR